MKILQITPTFIPSRFGGVSLFYNLSENLVKRGHEVIVYTTDINDRSSRLSNIQSGMDIDGIKVYYFRNISNSLALKYRLSLPKGMSIAVKREISSFDMIHLHNFRTFQNIIIHHYAKKYGTPYVLQAHGSVETFFQKGMLKRIFDRIWGRRILKDASKLIALTPMEVEQYKRMGVSEDKIEIMPNGIDLSEFDNLPAKGEFRSKHGLTDNQQIVLYLGRIHKMKGLDLLVKVFAELSKEVSHARLVIVGPDDGYLPALKELIKELRIGEKVLFTGPLYQKDKLEAYVDADVYVLPSVYETFPVAVLESCACGTPVILIDSCGIADIVNGQVGFAVLYDEQQLKEAILYLLSDANERHKFGERGKLLVRSQFSWSKIANQVENIYYGVLATSD